MKPTNGGLIFFDSRVIVGADGRQKGDSVGTSSLLSSDDQIIEYEGERILISSHAIREFSRRWNIMYRHELREPCETIRNLVRETRIVVYLSARRRRMIFINGLWWIVVVPNNIFHLRHLAPRVVATVYARGYSG